MVAPKGGERGVSLKDLRAAVALAHLHDTGDGLSWSQAEWERLWVRLSPVQQRVVFLHVLVGLTHTEVAEQLGIGRGSVGGAWQRALERIRDSLPN